jgi:hypothetical protein
MYSGHRQDRSQARQPGECPYLRRQSCPSCAQIGTPLDAVTLTRTEPCLELSYRVRITLTSLSIWLSISTTSAKSIIESRPQCGAKDY